MAKIISVFNHKGGVGKTTLLYNIAWNLAAQNQKVLLLDFDPQTNLSMFVHGFKEDKEYDLFTLEYQDIEKNFLSVFDLIAPVIYSYSEPGVAEKKVYTHIKNPAISLILGDIRFSNLDMDLSMVIQNSSELLRQFPYYFQQSIYRYKDQFDFILIDLSPNLGAINMLSVMSSDYFLVPIFPSYFSLQAIKNMAEILPQWYKKLDPLKKSRFNPSIGFEETTTQFMGIVSQNFRKYDEQSSNEGHPSKILNQWEDKINEETLRMAKELYKRDMAIDEGTFCRLFPGKKPYCIESIPDYNQLKVRAEGEGIPVAGMNNDYLKKVGLNTSQYQDSVKMFREKFTQISNGLIAV